jgi:3-oxoacyl-[acyl-carrier protein] reductase
MDKRVAVITGASRGIGSSIAKKMSDLGYYVIGTSTTAGEVDQNGHVAQWLQVDFSNQISLTQFLKDLDNLDQIDALINNSGINIIKPLDEVSIDDYLRIEQINLRAPFFISGIIAKKMGEAGKGKIVNIASIWSVVSKKNRTLYSTMKSGLHGLTRSMAVEFAEKGVLINSVSPGFVNTDLTKESLSKADADFLKDQIPLNRFAETYEIAELVAFLAGDSNSYITGQNIIIDGGFTGI